MHGMGKNGSKPDFGAGRIPSLILRQAIPLAIAQLVQLLYNIVDRIYIGHMPGDGTLALTGIGITFPLISLIAAFTNLYGMGGMPLFSMARGADQPEKARTIMGHTMGLLIITSVILMAVIYLFQRPLLFLFGASAQSFPYANAYLSIYLLGTPCAMISIGMNGFINAQGYPTVGMLTTVLGAVLNLILDPVLIYVLHWGVQGAAVATVISQTVSCAWVLRFLIGGRAEITLKRKYLRPTRDLSRKIVTLGSAGFMMSATNGIVQAACTSTLQLFGGDLYVSIFTVLCSVREIMHLPIQGLTHGSQPVLGFNFGARKYDRVRSGIRFMTLLGLGYTLVLWVVVLLFPGAFLGIFSRQQDLIVQGMDAMRLFFAGFLFMTFQFAGQAVFQGLGYAPYAVFFSILRKVLIVVPLTLLLPRLGLGVNGVFLAEPISDVIGGLACFLTMRRKVYRRLEQEGEKRNG